MLIDFHAHIFTDALAPKARAVLMENSHGAYKHCTDMTLAGLLGYMNAHGVDKSVVLPIVTKQHQTETVNRWAADINDGERIVSFGSIFPHTDDYKRDIDLVVSLGLKGIKLHPDYQHFFVDDEKMFPIYKKIAELGFITVFHAGVDIGYPKPVHCTPERLLRVLDLFDDAPVVAAHFGGWLLWDSVLEDLCGTKVYLDTAFSSGKMPPDYAKELIKAHGADKVLLGSDMPWSDTLDEVRFVQSLDLSAEDEEKILSNNAKRLLNI